MRPSCTTRSSRRPRLPGGLVRESRRARIRVSNLGSAMGQIASEVIDSRAREEDEDEDFQQLFSCAEAIAVHAADTFVEIGSRAANDQVCSSDDDYAGAPSEEHRCDYALGDGD